jgi:hypothetical protein
MPFDAAGYHLEPVADYIDRARAMIATPDRWCQLKLVDGVRHCAIGALTAVVFGDGDYGYLAVNMAMCFDRSAKVPDRWPVPARLVPLVDRYNEAVDYLDHAARKQGFDGIMRLNDDRSVLFRKRQHKRVLRTMSDAATRARADVNTLLGFQMA